MTEYKFFVPGKTKAAQMARTVRNSKTGKVHSFRPKETTEFKNLIKHYANEAGVKMMEGPVYLRLIIAAPMRGKPLKTRRKPPEWKTTTPDRDNYEKSVQDALKWIAYKDDAQVVCGPVQKIYLGDDGLQPGMVVILRSATDTELFAVHRTFADISTTHEV